MESNPLVHAHRKTLRMAIAATCLDQGFAGISEAALETLTEMTVSYVHELGRSSRALAELAGRTQPMVTDLSLALVEMGCDVRSLPGHLRQRRHRLSSVTPPSVAQEPSKPRTLQIGNKRSFPSFVPEYYPPFPDSHCFIRTPTHKPPVNEYQEVREKNASQKRDVERALTKFIAKTSATISLFALPGASSDDCAAKDGAGSRDGKDGSSENSTDPATDVVGTNSSSTSSHAFNFPLIHNGPKPRPYVTALLTKDRELNPDGDEDKEKTEKPSTGIVKSEENEDNEVDNPFVRPVKLPKIQRKKR